MAQVGETELDVGVLARALWRRAWLVILLAALAAAGTYYALGFVEPLYTADTSILIEARESPLTRTREQAGEPVAEFDESAIQSQVQVLRSRQIADAVVDRLDLTRRPEFDPATRPSLIGSLMVLVGAKRHPVEDTIRQRVMESYFERLSVYPVQKSRVIAVEFSAPSPTLAAEVANAVAEGFVDLQQDAKRETAVAATAWLEQEIDRLRERVEEAEQAVSDYRANNQLFNVDQTTGNLSTQQLSDLNAELARARAARAEAESRAKLVQSLLSEGGSLEASQEVLESQLIQRLQERQVALRSQIAELSTTFLPGHPRLRALEGQLANLEGQIRQEAQKVQASLNTAARVAAAREQSLVESLNAAKVDVSRSGDQEIELRALEREAAAQRDLLESLLARYREALARTDTSYLPADARIISRAVAPIEPSFPKKTMMSVAAGLATLLVISAVLLLREFTSGRAFRVIHYGYPGVPGVWRDGQGSPYAPVIYSPPGPRSRRASDRDDLGPEMQAASAGLRNSAGRERRSDRQAAIAAPTAAAAFVDEPVPDNSHADASAPPPVEPVAPAAAVSQVSEDRGSAREDDLLGAAAAGIIPIEAAVLAEAGEEPGPYREVEPQDAVPAAITPTGAAAPSEVSEDSERARGMEPLIDTAAGLVPTAAAAPSEVSEDPGSIREDERPDATPAAIIPAAAGLQVSEGPGPAYEHEPPGPTPAAIVAAGDPARSEVSEGPERAQQKELPGANVAAVAPTADAGPSEPGEDREPADTHEGSGTAAAAAIAATAAAAAASEEPAALPPSATLDVEADRPGTAELAEILAGQGVRVAVFAGAEGGEGAGAIAFSAARHAARQRLRFILLDVGSTPSAALGGYEQPGLGELLGGEAAFGEVIQRDEASRVHFIPMGGLGDRPLQRLHIAVGALTHTYDKVIVVADSLGDWPHEQVRPDLIAIVCGPGSTEELRANAYDAALERGAASAIIVRYANEPQNTPMQPPESAAA